METTVHVPETNNFHQPVKFADHTRVEDEEQELAF